MPFLGTCAFFAEVARLYSRDYPGLTFDMRSQDVRHEVRPYLDDRVSLKVDAELLGLYVPENSPFLRLPTKDEPSVSCASGKTKCLDGTRICCDERPRIIGSCVGQWRCEDDKSGLTRYAEYRVPEK